MIRSQLQHDRGGHRRAGSLSPGCRRRDLVPFGGGGGGGGGGERTMAAS